MQRRKFSPLSQKQTTKNKTQSSFNLSRTETEKLVDSAQSKIPQENARNTSSSRKLEGKSNEKLVTNDVHVYKRDNNGGALHQLKSPQESEFVEFNVYDFTRHKESYHNVHEANNTRDTADFGDIDPPDQLAETVKPYNEKLISQSKNEDNQIPEKEKKKGKLLALLFR